MSTNKQTAGFSAPWDLMIDHLTGVIVHPESYTEFFLLPVASVMVGRNVVPGRKVVPAKQKVDKPVDFS